MTIQEAIVYCHNHRNQFLGEAYRLGENGLGQFYHLVDGLIDGSITPEELPEYGMEFPEKTDNEIEPSPSTKTIKALARNPKRIANDLDSGREDDKAWLLVVPLKYTMQVARERDELRTAMNALFV